MVPGVDEANLTDCDITDAGLPQLADWKNLRSLGLAGTAITDRGLKHLTDLPALERLDMAHTAVTDAGLRLLPDKSLKMLWLDQTAVTDDGVVELVKRIPLESLSLKYTWVSAETADRLRAARPSLDIQPDELPAAAIVPFVATVQRPGVLLDYDKEHQLIGVYFHESEPTDEDLEQLAKIPSIKLLSLQDQRISDEGFAALTQLTNLESLGPRGTPLTNGLARNLARLEKLTWLDLASTELGDAGLEHITRLARLEWLSLEGTAITDAAVERLAKLPRLEGLVVAGTKLTPAGIERLGAPCPIVRSIPRRPTRRARRPPPVGRPVLAGCRPPKRRDPGQGPIPVIAFSRISKKKDAPCQVLSRPGCHKRCWISMRPQQQGLATAAASVIIAGAAGSTRSVRRRLTRATTRSHAMQLGMIGLGRMGANMVRRLIKAGHQCVVFECHPAAVSRIGQAGGRRSQRRWPS